jgi:hypothetical protein
MVKDKEMNENFKEQSLRKTKKEEITPLKLHFLQSFDERCDDCSKQAFEPLIRPYNISS